jgi:hypothetical protein
MVALARAGIARLRGIRHGMAGKDRRLDKRLDKGRRLDRGNLPECQGKALDKRLDKRLDKSSPRHGEAEGEETVVGEAAGRTRMTIRVMTRPTMTTPPTRP